MNHALWQAHLENVAERQQQQNRRRISGRCLYCGAHLRHGRKTTCNSHQDLPNLDPHHQPETRKTLEAPPDLPVLILTTRHAKGAHAPQGRPAA